MKKKTQRRKRTYRLLGVVTFLSILVSVLFGFFISEDACLSALFTAATLITLGAILSSALESAAQIARERNETVEIASVSRKMPKRS